MNSLKIDLKKLPGGDLIERGLLDISRGFVTIPSCLVVIAFPKLSQAGLIAKETPLPLVEGERTLFRLLNQEPGDAYSRYNALLRQLVSFERALGNSRSLPTQRQNQVIH